MFLRYFHCLLNFFIKLREYIKMWFHQGNFFLAWGLSSHPFHHTTGLILLMHIGIVLKRWIQIPLLYFSVHILLSIVLDCKWVPVIVSIFSDNINHSNNRFTPYFLSEKWMVYYEQNIWFYLLTSLACGGTLIWWFVLPFHSIQLQVLQYVAALSCIRDSNVTLSKL